MITSQMALCYLLNLYFNHILTKQSKTLLYSAREQKVPPPLEGFTLPSKNII